MKLINTIQNIYFAFFASGESIDLVVNIPLYMLASIESCTNLCPEFGQGAYKFV